jgi:DNA-binding winged helix-turn-helix (wHTH) protein/Tol biopolymer transport system component
MAVGQKQTVRFGPFELDSQCGELRKNDIRLRLQGQPIQILEMLLARPGELVTREEIQQRLWPADTFVDFDHSLNTAVKKLRQALGDEADAPRYVETLPKRGYRFIGAVEITVSREESLASAEATVTMPGPVALPKDRTRRRGWILAACLVTLFIATGLIYLGSKPPSLPTITGSHPVATNIHSTLPLGEAKLLTDGKSIYFQKGSDFSTFQVPVTGGDVSEIPAPNGRLMDIAPDGSEILFMAPQSPPANGFNLLAKPLPIGPLRMVVKGGRFATWSPDGQFIFFVRGTEELVRARADGSDPQPIVKLEEIFGPHVSPDGSRIRFEAGSEEDLWEIGSDGRNLHPVLTGQKTVAGATWSLDGRVYFFSAWDGDRISLWAAPDGPSWWQTGQPSARKLTFGPTSYSRPTLSKDGRQLFALGEEHQGELSVYDHSSGKFIPYLGGISACYVDFSRDGQWMTYVAYPEGSLWRSKVDGSEKRQLTRPPLAVVNPRWSPDGKLIVFTDRSNGDRRQMDSATPRRIYAVSADGGAPSLLVADSHPGGPTWSPDGNSIAVSAHPHPNGREVRIVDLRTQKSTTVAGSEGMWSSRWSPDGKYLVALKGDPKSDSDNRIMLYSFSSQTWQELASGANIGWPSWSHDGKSVFAQADDWLIRIDVASHKRENVASLHGFRSTAYALDRWDGGWYGLAPDDRPITTRDTGIEALYAFDLEYK